MKWTEFMSLRIGSTQRVLVNTVTNLRVP